MRTHTMSFHISRIHDLILPAIIFILMSALKLSAQEPVGGTPELEKQIELFTEKTESEADFSEFQEEIDALRRNPVNINSRNIVDLARLFVLDQRQLHQLLAYTTAYGDLLTIYELKAIDGFDSATIRQILPYIVLAPSQPEIFSLKQAVKGGRHSVLLRWQRVLQKQEGYLPASDSLLEARPDARYKGSPDRLLLKYGYDYRTRLRWGLTAEKDPGEEFFGGSQPQGFDFYSGYVFARDLGPVRRVVVGDYHAAFGQGLVMWSGLSFGKAGLAGGIVQNAGGIRPSASANEVFFLRGGALTLGIGPFEVSAFASHLALDARTQAQDSITEGVRSLLTTGFHRTPSEISSKGAIHLTTMGGNLSYNGAFFKVGVTAVSAGFDQEFQPKTGLYNQFQQPLQHEFTAGADVRVYLRKLILMAEMARDIEGKMAGIINATWKPDPRFSLNAIYRNYDKAFRNYYSNAFGENSGVYNEEGVYLGCRVQPARYVEISAFADFFRFPWFRYRVDGPSQGREYYFRADIRLGRQARMHTRYRYEEKPVNTSESGRKTNVLFPRSFHNFRFHIDYEPIAQWVFASRVEMIFNKTVSSGYRQGFLLYQDFSWKPEFAPMTLTARFAHFDTDTYDERLYAYERDVLYSFSIPAYYYNGQRVYLMLKYEWGERIDLWLRLASSFYDDRSLIGSGLDAISGSTRTEAKLQLVFKL